MILFGDPVLSINIDNEHLTKLIDNIKKLEEFGLRSHTPWEACSVQSTYKLFNIFDLEEFNWFNTIIFDHIKKYIETYKIPSINFDNYKLNGWLNFYNKGDYQEVHDHCTPTTVISGSLLIHSDKDRKNAGSFSFYNKNVSNLKYINFYDQNNINLCESWTFHPEPGHLLIFPSYLPHYVTTNNTTTTRISLSFNLQKYK